MAETDAPRTVTVRAFRITVHGIECVSFAVSAGQARYSAFKAAREAGYNWSLTEFTVRCAPEYDSATLGGLKPKPRVAYGIEHLTRPVTP